MSTGPTGTISFPTRIPQLPPNLLQLVNVYKLLVNDYNTVTDSAVKTAYTTVLASKYSEITSVASSYNSTFQSFISSLQPPQ